MPPPADLRRALDPKRSCVVVACAGSGKTWLLTSRIMRALLAGAHPDEILAITFTRKATGEIRERVGSLIDEFAEADDEGLARRLKEIGAGTDPEIRERARALRRNFLLSDKGMSIHTFDGWFLRLLRSAPWLPNPSIPRQVAEAQQLLLEEAWNGLLKPRAAGTPEGKDLLRLVELIDQQVATVKEMLKGFVGRRKLWLRFKAKCGKGVDPVDAAVEELGGFLQAGPEDDPEKDLLESEEFWECVDQIRALAASVGKPPDKAQRFLDSRLEERHRSSRGPCLEALKEALLTKTGTPRRGLDKGALELVADKLEEAQNRLARALDHRHGVEALRFNRLALSVADAWLRRYDAIKGVRGEHDFADFEVEACGLLSDEDAGKANAEAIRYKMGQDYRHILVDEFQDTNALQWEALRAWLDSVRDTDAEPKVFIVGDPKQSVYRFRGGDPALLDEAEDYLKGNYGARTIRQNVTRRCAPKLLDIVNGVFTGELAGFKTHEAFEGNARLPGRVELLAEPSPAEEAPAAEGKASGNWPLPLRNPLTAPPPKGGDRDFDKALPGAQALAQRLRAAKEEWAVTLPDGTARPCEWNDFMVLFAQRTSLPALERALRSADVPCISDSGSGLNSLECQDILALMQSLASPRSNLLLLQVLRSPLFGVSSEDLTVLAAGRGREQRAWRSLQRAEGLSPRMARARDLLGKWRRLYREQPMPAHDFMSEIYRRAEVFARYDAAVPKGIRHRVRANLRMLLHMSLREGMARHPHLPRLLREYRRLTEADDGDREDPPLGAEVALLTVHKAKGLERPFVFVYNADRSFGHSQGSTATWTLTGVPRADGVPLPAFCPSGAQGTPKAFDGLLAEEKGKELAEWRNKLYIALTRARQGVVVCSSGKPGKESWYGMVESAVRAAAGKEATFHGDDLAAEGADAAGEASGPEPLPEPLPELPELPEAEAAEIVAQQWTPHRIQTSEQERGEQLHAILALRISGVDDPAVAWRAAPMQRSRFDELWEVSGGMLAAPAVRRLLGPENPGARVCEVELAGPDGQRRLDCIVEFEGALWILDFKTGDVEAGMDKYRRQLGGYGALLRAACPDREIRCALVSERGDLIEVEGA